MQSNVTVPVSGSKFKLWLILVVLAVAIFGGAAYGYYSWYKANEPPPSLEMKDGTGLQGLIKIQDGGDAIKGFAKLEKEDVVTDCSGRGTTKLEGDTMDYLYSLEEVTLKDFYDSIAVKENVGRIFMFVFYSPGEEVGITDPTKYSTGFYLFPATETIYKASHVELKNLANYKIPAFRSVILWHSGTIDVCAEKVGPAFGTGKLSEDYTAILNENLKPLPKGYVLVPFGWNSDQVGVLKAKLGGYISSMWFKAGSGGDIKVKGEGLDGSLLEEAIESLKTRSVWLNVKKDKTDVVEIVNQEDDKLAPSILKVEYNEGKGSQAVFVSFSEKVKDFDLDGLCKLKEPMDDSCSGENLVKKEGFIKSADLKEGTVNINLQSKLEPGIYKVSFSKVSDFSGNVSSDISYIFKIDPIVKKKAGEVCDSGGQCVEGLSCVLSEGGGVCGTAKSNKEVCDLVCGEKYPKCNVVDLKTDPVDVLCDPSLVKVCESDAGCDGGKKCVDVPKEYQEVAGGAKICAIPKGGKCDLNINCSPGLVCSKDKESGTSACVESECDACGDLACTSLGDGGGFSSVTCGEVKDTKAPEVKCVVPGDVDADGKVDCKLDTLALLNIINGKTLATPCADVNSDGIVDIQDSAQLTTSFCSDKPKEICDNCEELGCFGKTDKDGFTCCNDGTEKVDSPVCGDSEFCDVDTLKRTYRCIGGCTEHSDCPAGQYCDKKDSSCVGAPEILSVTMGGVSDVLNVAFSVPLGGVQSISSFMVTAANDPTTKLVINSVGADTVDKKILVLNMGQKLSSGEYLFKAAYVALWSGSSIPLTGKNAIVFSLVVPEAACNDDVDDDGDGKVDCLDTDCSGKTNLNGFVCCNDGTEAGSTCGEGFYCDTEVNGKSWRCIKLADF